MSDAPDQQESFISHLIELRNRLIRAVASVVLIFICLFPWANDLYSLLAQPLIAKLPQGSQMIALLEPAERSAAAEILGAARPAAPRRRIGPINRDRVTNPLLV